MRFHLVALPHTRTSKEFSACAYTQKCLLMTKMMRSLGHEVYHYGAEGSEADCTEHITVITAAEQERFFGQNDWHKRMFDLKWNPEEPYWQIMNHRAAAEIVARSQKKDFLCLIGGLSQKPIADAVGEKTTMAVEFGVGYYGVFSKFRVFESYTHQACVYGMLSKDPDGSLYDCVIPNYYDPEDFPFCSKKEDYLLFIGRAIQRKGIQIAVDVARASGMRLVVAGQGVEGVTSEKLTCEGGYVVNIDGAQVEYAGYADVSKRAELMGRARAVVMPTLFMEPFGGVAVEAQLCGTPVISTDHAAFSETVKHGKTGFRCHSLAEFVWAATDGVGKLDPQEIRRIAVANYSIDRVKLMYDEYFSLLHGLWGKGWPDMTTPLSGLDWLIKE